MAKHHPLNAVSPATVYTLYRITLALFLLALFFFTDSSGLGESNPKLFIYALSTHLIILIPALWLPSPLKSSDPLKQTMTFIVDLLVLVLVIHSSGSISSSLTALVFVTVATASMLLLTRYALLIAALAALALMFEQFYYGLSDGNVGPAIPTAAGLLGIGLFGVALAMRNLATRLERSEVLTHKQDIAIRRLEELNKQVVARMLTGIVVFDDHLNIQLANSAATDFTQASLSMGSTVPTAIRQAFDEWRSNTSRHPSPIPATASRPELEIRFAALDPITTVAFIENRSHLLQQAQALKLASLGQLTATIAHEIRNPLSAISHAAQLLEEGEIGPQDKPMINIIHRHVERLNRIVSDILSVSRGHAPQPQKINFPHFLEQLMQRWQEQGLDTQRIKLEIADANFVVIFDNHHLGQVMENLITNALKYSDTTVTITASYRANGIPQVSISDKGSGVPADHQHRLFEPFFTLAKDGTGLGLFLSREHCQGNQAQLTYQDNQPGACFVITFVHPNKNL